MQRLFLAGPAIQTNCAEPIVPEPLRTHRQIKGKWQGSTFVSCFSDFHLTHASRTRLPFVEGTLGGLTAVYENLWPLVAEAGKTFGLTIGAHRTKFLTNSATSFLQIALVVVFAAVT